jgi:Complex 1 protein (LYR family)
MSVVKSGIQKEVLALYRTLLREAMKKDLAAGSVSTSRFTDLLMGEDFVTNHVRDEFRKQATQVSRKDFRTIEYRIRHGYKQIKLLQMPGVKTFKSFTT